MFEVFHHDLVISFFKSFPSKKTESSRFKRLVWIFTQIDIFIFLCHLDFISSCPITIVKELSIKYLHVHLLRRRRKQINIRPGLSDPYCILQVGKVKQRTKVKKKVVYHL